MLNRWMMVLTASTGLAACAAPGPMLRVSGTGQLQSCQGQAGCVSSLADDAEHHIEPIRYSGNMRDGREKLDRVLHRMQIYGYAVVTSDGDYLYATYTSPTLKQTEDLEFVFSQARPGVIEVRASGRGFAGSRDSRQHVEDVRLAYTIAKS